MVIGFLRGRDLRQKAKNPLDVLWDARLGVRTFGYAPGRGAFESPDWQSHYIPTTYDALFRMLRRAELGPTDVFADLGCGLGRAVFVAHRLGARCSIGVEVDERLHREALANARRARLDPAKVRFVLQDVAAFDPSGASVFFLYNAFGTATLRAFLCHLGEDLRRVPRRARLVYFCPTREEIVAEVGFLRRYDYWTEPPERHPVSFWESVPEQR